MKRLIVTADDLGESPDMNYGIMKAFDQGLVTSASLLVGGEWAQAGADEARARPGLSLGLHLAFVQATPVCQPESISSLLDARGRFRRHAWRMLVHRPRVQDLWREASAQMRRYRELVGRPPDFINSHQHAQVIPQVLYVMRRLCQRHGVQRLRLSAEQEPFRPNRRGRSWLWPAVSAVSRAGRPFVHRSGVRTPDRMIGGPESGRIDLDRLLRLLTRLKAGTTELVVHPRLGSPELRALTAPQVADLLSELGVERIGFNVL